MGADEEIRELEPGSDGLLAARVAVGSLGVLVSVTLRTVPCLQPASGRCADGPRPGARRF